MLQLTAIAAAYAAQQVGADLILASQQARQGNPNIPYLTTHHVSDLHNTLRLVSGVRAHYSL